MKIKQMFKGQMSLGSIFLKTDIKIQEYGIAKLKRKLRRWTTKEICVCYNGLRDDRSLEAMKTKQTLILELKRRDKDTFYLWLYDSSNLNNPGAYFIGDAK